MSAGRILLLVFGTLFALLGMAFAAGGGGLLWLHGTQRDDDGFYTTSPERFETSTYALTSDEVDLGATSDAIGWAPDVGDLATVRVRATAAESGGAVFVGIGPASAVESYLAGVAHDQVADVDYDPFRVRYSSRPGSAAPEPPGQQPFWAAQASGAGTQAIEWELESGRWAVVVMDAGGARGVSVDVGLGVRSDLILPLGIGLLAGGLVLLGAGVTMVAFGARGPRAGPAPPSGGAGTPTTALPYPTAAAAAAAEAPVAAAPYPVRLEGELDDGLSRWLWLVKWLLAIPHYIVLVFLWIAFVVLTAVALVAILVTGRYPRGIFDFNVGVMRWSWRVAFYSYSALGTDRYPPFSLAREEYPATLEVAYPQELSRGLALVKWWLLAIPHYVVVGIFGAGLWWTGGWAGTEGWDEWGGWWGGGLLGVLVLIAAVWLLFTGRYPREVFRLVMGLNRWTFRVLAYAALMRDEYPPFRLDTGAREPVDDRTRPTPGA